MLSNLFLSGIIMFSGPTFDNPNLWTKIKGNWSYVGEVKEKEQILFWIEKKTKTPNYEIINREIKKMPFIILHPNGEVVSIKPLQ